MGLIACCSDYFSGLFPKLGYRGWAVVFAVVSMVISNAGLTLILKFSIPVLVAIYPLAIVLIALVNSVRLLSIVYWFADSVNR